VGEPTDAEMWRSVETTVRNVLLPSITDEWARVITVQLVGLARYASTRPPDPTAARVAELATTLELLAGNPVVAAHWQSQSTEPLAVLRAVGAILADGVSRDDQPGDDIRSALRSVVSRHLDEDLAVTGMLMPYFRGQLPDA
jgi:hypothetical protein